MLHKINIACEAEFSWIIQLQQDLLTAVCRPSVSSDTVTTEWVKSIRPNIEASWLEGFCNSHVNLYGVRTTLISHLKAIAEADKTTKN